MSALSVYCEHTTPCSVKYQHNYSSILLPLRYLYYLPLACRLWCVIDGSALRRTNYDIILILPCYNKQTLHYDPLLLLILLY